MSNARPRFREGYGYANDSAGLYGATRSSQFAGNVGRRGMFEQLEYHLANKNWKKADTATLDVLRHAMGAETDSHLYSIHLKPEILPFIREVDRLWRQYTHGSLILSSGFEEC